MPLAYAEAVRLVQEEAQSQRQQKSTQTETCSIYNACDRVVSTTIYSPISTPQYDTSAMDGFALSAAATANASPEGPVTFEVMATTTAGDKPHSTVDDLRDGVPPCVEIMTGAPFPLGFDRDWYDCCVPVEDVVVSENKFSKRRYIAVSKPARYSQHRRFAGGDFSKRDVIIEAGQTVLPQHVMAMASVGLAHIPVMPRPRVAVFSTGCELLSPDALTQPHDFMIHDANGPYLTAMLRQWGIDVDFRGVVRDSPEAMQDAISTALDAEYDIIVTTGAVSAGRCDFIPGLVNRIGGRTVFHKAAVKPGHPILFSMLPCTGRETAFFGLPGNPVAAAACLRFFVLQYLEKLQLQNAERPQTVALTLSNPNQNGLSQCNGVKSSVLSFRKDPDIFRPGILTPDSRQAWIIDDHSPGKTKPFLYANCWVHIPSGVSELGEGSLVDIYPN